MAQVIATFTDFLVGSQDAVHGADRAMVDALVEQDSVDLRGGLVGKIAARAEGRVWLDVPRQPARAVGSAWAEARPTAGPDRYADGRRWRATRSGPRRHRRSDRESSPARRPLPS